MFHSITLRRYRFRSHLVDRHFASPLQVGPQSARAHGQTRQVETWKHPQQCAPRSISRTAEGGGQSKLGTGQSDQCNRRSLPGRAKGQQERMDHEHSSESVRTCVKTVEKKVWIHQANCKGPQVTKVAGQEQGIGPNKRWVNHCLKLSFIGSGAHPLFNIPVESTLLALISFLNFDFCRWWSHDKVCWAALFSVVLSCSILFQALTTACSKSCFIFGFRFSSVASPQYFLQLVSAPNISKCHHHLSQSPPVGSITFWTDWSTTAALPASLVVVTCWSLLVLFQVTCWSCCVSKNDH